MSGSHPTGIRAVDDHLGVVPVPVPTLDDVAMVYLRVDDAGTVQWANEPALQLLRHAPTPHDALVNVAGLAHDGERRGIEAALADARYGSRAEVVVRLAATAEIGPRRHLHLVMSREDQAGTSIVIQGWDVSALVIRLRELESHPYRDPLTGLANRMSFMDRLRQELARSARSGTALAVLVADVDGFTTVNSFHGHDDRDTVLVEISHRLAGSLRPRDTLARIGSNEFAVLCPELTGPHRAMAVADRLRAAAAEPMTFGGRRQLVTLSLGVAFAGDDHADTSAAALLRRATPGRSWTGPARAGPT
jgi:diguanylate cyclase (GGDEF)-like protein